jgi:hypothetical protein
LSHFATEKLDRELVLALRVGNWNLVDKVLKTLSGSKHAQRLKQHYKRDFASEDKLRPEWIYCHFSQHAFYNAFHRELLLPTFNFEVPNHILVTTTTPERRLLVDDKLESALTHLVGRRQWKSVGKVMNRGVSDTKHRWAIEEASNSAKQQSFIRHILPHASTIDHLESALTHLVDRRLWKSVALVLKRGVSATQHRWATKEASKNANQRRWKYVGLVLEKGGVCAERVGWAVLEACKNWTYTTEMQKIVKMLGRSSIETLLDCVFSNQLPSHAQNMALRFALKQNRWDVISGACLSQVWEQVRREMFRAAVEQGRWDIVKQWADRTLYLDRRWRALQEAYKHKQWGVMLLLADHGLNGTELMWVRYRIAMYADWNVVLRIFRRGVDVTEVRELVENVMTARKNRNNPAKREALGLR